ncbi:MAG: GNAT family N-acetyltransferase [Planctomycetota bacterium]
MNTGPRIVTLTPQHFAAAAKLQRDCYPTLDPAELMGVAQFDSQHKVFPEGQFIALAHDGQTAIGMASGFFCDFDFNAPHHTFRGFCDHLYFRNHNPRGAWYYGADICVHPNYRGQGVGRLLYQARQDLVIRHGKRGIVAGGLIPGFADHKHRMTAAQYVDAVARGELHDPTLSFQLRNGFVVHGVIEDYLEDAASDGWASLIAWEPPENEADTQRV